jgi:hypothetical protein
MKIAIAETQVGGANSCDNREVLYRTISLIIANQRGHELKYDKHLRPAEGPSLFAENAAIVANKPKSRPKGSAIGGYFCRNA